MDTVITFIQVYLGLAFTVGGLIRLTLPHARYANLPNQGWAKDFKPVHVRLIGFLEMWAGIGIIVPLVLDSLTILTPIPAVGIALVMAGAMTTHLRRAEYLSMVGNLWLLGLALFVAYDKLLEVAA